ncbi:MAG: hypothetical protein DWQ37_07605 [Planctomycetota bacterium]|nr:MAG: hypothetical protein DWQ37_07605 [Planctomycetota bacterium]
MTDQVLILSNPGAGSRFRTDVLAELTAAIQAAGLACQVIDRMDALAETAAGFHAQGKLRAVVAAGGDGTVAAAANHVAPEVPITVYPLGTANLLAGYFRIGRDPQAMARMLRDNCRARFDAGRAGGRRFLLMASCGFDADVVRRLHEKRLGKHITYWTWARPLLESIRRYRYPELRVSCFASDGTLLDEERRVRWAFAVNFPVYAGGLGVAPEADAADGVLDVCTFRQGSPWHALRYAASVALGFHRRFADFHCMPAARVRIESDEPIPYQLDGDYGGVLPLEIECIPGCLTLVVPRQRALELGLQLIEPTHAGS